MSEHLLRLLLIPAFAFGLIAALLLAAWFYTAPVRAERRDTVKRFRKEYDDEYAEWWGEKMGMSKREIRRAK